MAKKKENVVVDVEVSEKPMAPRKKRASGALREILKKQQEAESLIEESIPTTKVVNRVSDNGAVNIEGIAPKEKKYYMQIASSLNEKDMSTISSYGCDLQKAMDSYSNAFLSQRLDSNNSIESSKLIEDLVNQLKEVNIDDLEAPSTIKSIIRRVPLLRKLVTSVEQIKTKYHTIQQNIDEIVSKLEATRQIAIRDNNLLQKQFENNVDYVDQLEDLIIAGKLKSDELASLITEMKENAQDYREYEISDVEEYKDALDKRVSDLSILRFAFKQSLPQIRIIQRTNMMDATNTESQIAMTVPLWKNQLSLAVALCNQKKSVAAKNKVYETTNEILKKNAEMMQQQAVEIAQQNQRSPVDIETLREMTAKLTATVEGIKKAKEEGAAKRAAAEAELLKLEEQSNMALIGVKEAAQHVIAKELASSREAKKELMGEQ